MPIKDKLPLKPMKTRSAKVPASTERVKTVRLSHARRAAILKALADPRRYELLEHIAKASCPLGCAQARTALPISAATLSHHVKELEAAGLIKIRREGKFHFMTLRAGVLEALATTLAAMEQSPCGASLKRQEKRFS